MTLKRKRILIAFIVLISCVVIAVTIYLCMFFFMERPGYHFEFNRNEVERYLPKYRLLEDDPLFFDSAQYKVDCTHCTKAQLNKSDTTYLTATYHMEGNVAFTVYYDFLPIIDPELIDRPPFAGCVTQETYEENGFTITTQTMQNLPDKNMFPDSFVGYFQATDSSTVAVEILSDDPSSVKEKAKSIVSKLTKLYAS